MTTVGLVLFDEVDLLDVGGPYEVFLTANRLARRAGRGAPFEVTTVGATTTPVRAYGGLGLVPAAAMDDVGHLDVVVVPGTIDVDAASADAGLASLLDRAVARADLVTTVCTGSVLLARAGLLDGVAAATTHHEDLGELAASLGDAAVTARWVDAGDVVTAGGLSSGIAMALHLVHRLAGRDLAVATAAQLAYAWDPDDGTTVS